MHVQQNIKMCVVCYCSVLVCALVGTFTALFCILHYIISWAILVLRIVFLCNFALMQLENLHHFLNLHNSFWSNMIWRRWSVATLVSCWRPADSDVTVMPSVMCILFNSTGFVTKMSEKHKRTSPNAIQLKNWHKTISTEEKLDVISRLEKGEWTVC